MSCGWLGGWLVGCMCLGWNGACRAGLAGYVGVGIPVGKQGRQGGRVGKPRGEGVESCVGGGSGMTHLLCVGGVP